MSITVGHRGIQSQQPGIFERQQRDHGCSESQREEQDGCLAGWARIRTGGVEGRSCVDALTHGSFAVKKGSSVGQEADGSVWARGQLHSMN